MRRPKVGLETWHVFARGSRRLALFYTESDYLKFLSILQFALRVSGCGLVAWCLMENHYHLVLKATSEQITACMRRVNHLYSLYHNQQHGMTGHTFDGPYRAYHRRGLFFILRTIAYVLLNPVQAGLVAFPGQYRWCSALSFLGGGVDPLPVNALGILKQLDPNLDRARIRFRDFLRNRAKASKPTQGKAPTAFSVQQEQFAWLLEHAKSRNGDLEGVAPVHLAALWGRECGIPLRVMAASLGHSRSLILSSALVRLKKRLNAHPLLASRLRLDA